MDFAFSPEEEAFRKEVRDVLDSEMPDRFGAHLGGEFAGVPWGDPDYLPQHEEVSDKVRALVRGKGWRPLAWPKEYGGFGASIWQQVIFKEEAGARAAPTGGGLGELFIGPAIMAFGTEAQKQQHLQPISEGRDHWCQLYSEPDAGSDLASLKTRADEQGDHYVVNGSKIWTSSAPEAEWGFLFARTDQELPRHRGISCFLLDMKTPGVTVRPIPNMIRQYDISEVFFDNVIVPKSEMLGEKNGGWRIMMAGVGFERGGTLDYARTQRILKAIIDYCENTTRNGQLLIEDPVIQAKLAHATTKIEVTRLVNYKVMSVWASGALPDWEASLGKVFMDTVYQEVLRIGLEIMGCYGRVEYPDVLAPADGLVEYHSRPALHQTISPGTLEIQKNIIATRGLGLPRS